MPPPGRSPRVPRGPPRPPPARPARSGRPAATTSRGRAPARAGPAAVGRRGRTRSHPRTVSVRSPIALSWALDAVAVAGDRKVRDGATILPALRGRPSRTEPGIQRLAVREAWCGLPAARDAEGDAGGAGARPRAGPGAGLDAGTAASRLDRDRHRVRRGRALRRPGNRARLLGAGPARRRGRPAAGGGGARGRAGRRAGRTALGRPG